MLCHLMTRDTYKITSISWYCTDLQQGWVGLGQLASIARTGTRMREHQNLVGGGWSEFRSEFQYTSYLRLSIFEPHPFGKSRKSQNPEPRLRYSCMRRPQLS